MGDCWHLWGRDNPYLWNTLSVIQSFKCSLAYLKLFVIFHSARKQQGEWSLGGKREIRRRKVSGWGDILVGAFACLLKSWFQIQHSNFTVYGLILTISYNLDQNTSSAVIPRNLAWSRPTFIAERFKDLKQAYFELWRRSHRSTEENFYSDNKPQTWTNKFN